MKLLTKELEQRFKEIGDQSEKKAEDTIVVCKFFNPTGAGNWYATEYYPKSQIFFGYVSIFGDHNDELGEFSLKELEDYKGMLGLGIERDRHFTETTLDKVMTNN